MRPIGFFDSGMGGLSVVREARIALPSEHLLYFGDNAHAPYGEKSREEIVALSLQAAQRLARQNVKALVVACNTATAAAVEILRERYDFPVVGMEPAIKPALEAVEGKVAVLATPATLKMDKFIALSRQLHGEERLVPIPCPLLVPMVERGLTQGPEVEAYLSERLRLCPDAEAVVLGCTHYVFLKETVARLAGVPVLDGNAGTIRHLARLLPEREPEGEGSVTLTTSGDADRLFPVMRRMLEGPG